MIPRRMLTLPGAAGIGRWDSLSKIPASMFAELLEDQVWQMSRGERAAVEGVLAALEPALAIEIGSAEGASLRRIASHAREVHSFDLQAPTLPQPANVILHTGDSHELLAPFLAELAEADRNVDFALVDGDHSAEGVRRDLEQLLDSPAVHRTAILIHDTANEQVRRGVEAVRFAAWPKVAHVEPDWVPGRLFAEPELRNELWFGLGLVVVDGGRLAIGTDPYERRYHPAGPLLAEIRELVQARERTPPPARAPLIEATEMRPRLAELLTELGQLRLREGALATELRTVRARLHDAEGALEDIKGSASWRITEPLRAAKGRVGRRRQ